MRKINKRKINLNSKYTLRKTKKLPTIHFSIYPALTAIFLMTDET